MRSDTYDVPHFLETSLACGSIRSNLDWVIPKSALAARITWSVLTHPPLIVGAAVPPVRRTEERPSSPGGRLDSKPGAPFPRGAISTARTDGAPGDEVGWRRFPLGAP